MTEHQRQLILEYARTEQLVNGTVDGLERGLLYCVWNVLAVFLGPKLGTGQVPLSVFSECDVVCQVCD